MAAVEGRAVGDSSKAEDDTLTPSHGSESACKTERTRGRGGSAGVVNQAAGMSEPASSQHQGSSAPLPSQVRFNTTAPEASTPWLR